MDRQDFVLATLSPAHGATHSPVQVQKLFFLLDQNIPDLVGGPFFKFTPYNYGPFDRAVYDELEALAVQGYVELCSEGSWKSYRLTAEGQERADDLFSGLPDRVRDYITKASKYVRDLSFTQLVSAIYKAYPEMRENSVFQE